MKKYTILLLVAGMLSLTACMPPQNTVEDIDYRAPFIQEEISYQQSCDITSEEKQYDCQDRERRLNEKGEAYVKRLNELNPDALFTYDEQRHVIYKQRRETAQDKNSSLPLLNLKAVYN